MPENVLKWSGYILRRKETKAVRLTKEMEVVEEEVQVT